ncbi:MAG: ABC transporter substrate-binding protein [Rhodomicrobium sp.]
MSISRRKFVAGVTATGVVSLASSFPSPALVKNAPLRIGILTPKVGAAATVGECGLRGAQWAMEQVNKAGGIAGRQVEFVIEQETNPQGTIQNLQRLVEEEKVDCVQGIVSTGNSMHVAPVAEKMKALLILWDGTTQNGVKDTMPDARYIFKSTDNECEAVMASLLTVKYYKGKFRKIAGMNSDYSYGRNTWEAFKQILTRYGVEFQVVAELWPRIGVTPSELIPYVEKLTQAKPDLIFSAMSFADLPDFMSQAAAGLPKHVKYVLPEGAWQINKLKKSFTPEGTILGWNTLYFANPHASALQKEFVHYYFDRFKEAPHSEADRAYFAFAAYKAGVEAAHKKLGRWPSTEEIIDDIPGREIVGLGGNGRYRADKIAEQMFYQGPTTNKNRYEFPTLSAFEAYPASELQKPSGDDFWDWIKTAPLPL